jgi:hypothetical protein
MYEHLKYCHLNFRNSQGLSNNHILSASANGSININGTGYPNGFILLSGTKPPWPVGNFFPFRWFDHYNYCFVAKRNDGDKFHAGYFIRPVQNKR